VGSSEGDVSAFLCQAGLALYYYDLITTTIALAQVGVHAQDFATTGAIVAYHALCRVAVTKYVLSERITCSHAFIVGISLIGSPYLRFPAMKLGTCRASLRHRQPLWISYCHTAGHSCEQAQPEGCLSEHKLIGQVQPRNAVM
jgi:hypothetical protein